MKKCFDNIKLLDLARMKDRFEAIAMNSAEGEKVEFKGIVRLEGVVEVRSMISRKYVESAVCCLVQLCTS